MKLWEEYGENLHRMEVDGGYLYNSVKGLVFVRDEDVLLRIETLLTKLVDASDWTPRTTEIHYKDRVLPKVLSDT